MRWVSRSILKVKAPELRVWIEYELPAGVFGRIFGSALAGFYARWCVGRMATDAATHFASLGKPKQRGGDATPVPPPLQALADEMLNTPLHGFTHLGVEAGIAYRRLGPVKGQPIRIGEENLQRTSDHGGGLIGGKGCSPMWGHPSNTVDVCLLSSDRLLSSTHKENIHVDAESLAPICNTHTRGGKPCKIRGMGGGKNSHGNG